MPATRFRLRTIMIAIAALGSCWASRGCSRFIMAFQ